MVSDIAVLALPHLDPTFGRIEARALPGSTIAEIIARVLPQAAGAVRERLRVFVGEHVILPGLWHAVRPKAGTQIVIRVVPGDDILRNVLTIAVTVGALALGQFYAPALAGSLLGIGGSVTGGLTSALSAAITGSALIAGTLLINALIPVRNKGQDAPTYAIQGLRNQATPDGVVPSILGFHRYAPVYAALPFTEAIGDDRYVTAAFCFGYGPLAIRNVRIGETPIERFKDVQMELREGRPGDERLALYPRQVVEVSLSIEIKNSGPTGGPQSRFTAPDAASASIDITFPGGLGGFKKDGGTVNVTVDHQIRYRRAGTDDWTTTTVSVTNKNSGKPLTRTFPLSFPTRGRYEIEVTRTTGDQPDDQSKASTQRISRSSWSAMRSFRPEYIINFDQPLALAAVRIRASGQLNGTLDELNADLFCICPDWDAVSQAWITRETQNPASLFRHVLTGPAMRYPFGLDEVADLADWHAFCVAKGLTYNRVHDYEASVLDVISDIAAAGRASPHDTGERWGVVIDRIIDTVTAHISPRNSWGFQGERAFSKFPDAFRVSFLDETNGYAKADRIVPFPGFSGDPKVVEKLDLPGHTNPDMVWRETRRRQYELIHRPDTYTANQDFEALVVTRGDRAQLSHDVLDRTMVAARVTGVRDGLVYLDEAVTFVSGQAYACRFRRADGASLLRTVTGYGETHAFSLTGTGDLPEVENLAFFGPASLESFACTVKGVEAMENFTARLTLVDHAPQIEQMVDAEAPPPWSGRAGAEAQANTDAPVAPIVTGVASGREAAAAATDAVPYPVVVSLQPNPSGTVTVVSYAVRHRLLGATAWTTTTADAGSGAVLLPGYAKGNQIEFQARGISALGTLGELTALMTHVVAATDPIGPVAPEGLTITAQAGGARASWTSSASADNAASQVYVATGTSAAFSTAAPYGDPIASGPNVGLSLDLDLDPGPYSVFVVALDDDAPPNASIPRGPVNVTVV
ncbi:TipJ family phage tail tip protein [Methylobacterium goesingense]|uniref:Tip attachment protein J HDII-ins2 domain-containing protein n=1 Tax=Methylobacterium goesingense TaxID=243690 RepID=A0ABV2L3D3_9HYPH|nr:hypothetical protein [Methylobacterium goesingense]GJD73337.1 hypothetical protein CFIICLFH_1564 [Methylobacterium goesingense]